MVDPDPTRFEVKITATGTVRDKHGDIISQHPIEATTILTADEVQALTQGKPL